MRRLAFPLPGLTCLCLWFLCLSPTTASERQVVLDAMEARPSGVWPRGHGHVVLGIPGSTEDEKAYLEPGASFSPAFGSYGIQLVVENADGEVEVAGDFVPMSEIRQSWTAHRNRTIPGVRTETPEYVATWTQPDGKNWRLDATSLRHPRLLVVIRSVGPAGGAITNAAWDGRAVRINDRWALVPAQAPREILLGYQNPTNITADPGITTAVGGGTRITVNQGPRSEADRQAGWGRVVLAFDREVTLSLEDRKPPAPNPLKWTSTRAEITLNLPDSRFTNCLNAQVAQMMMGLVRNETRPGDPNHLPVHELRAGAPIAVALARAGQLEVARQLCLPFAQQDFFGGYGAEADAPGLALWAITEVANLSNDSRFDQSLKPHVQRKLDLIEQLLTTTETLRRPFTGPLIPRAISPADAERVCEPARDGLIQGRAETGRPVLYVNAVTYAGLRSASAFLSRTRDRTRSESAAQRATALRTAWNAALERSEGQHERNATCGLHPSWIVDTPATYRRVLEAARQQTHDGKDQRKERPLQTQIPIATAHQWLLLGEPGRAWNDLRWYWDHQTSPGLYVWWEGNGEDHTFDRWESVRGWVNPLYVSPQYGTAAEITLLQLAMLAYLDESGPQPVLVVGAGVPEEWLKERFSVSGLRTRLGTVSWDWDGRRLKVRAPGIDSDVIRPAGAFARGVPTATTP